MDVAQIIRIYEKRIKDLGVSSVADYAAAQRYAQKTGRALADVINQFVDMSTLTEETAVPLFSTALQANHKKVVRACRNAQRAINHDARIGMGLLDAEFDAEAARDVAMTIIDASEISPEFVRNLIVNQSNKVVDESIRKNIEAQGGAGLTVRITRKYDDVGLHDGKDPCQWCLDREGEWDDYQEAYNAGVFERHPGCGCVITYEVGKTRTWSGGGWQWHNLKDIGQ